MSIQTSSEHQINIHAILAHELREATDEYKIAKNWISEINKDHRISSLRGQKFAELNRARAKLQRIVKATYNFYYGSN